MKASPSSWPHLWRRISYLMLNSSTLSWRPCWPSKKEAILHIAPPKSLKIVCNWLDMASPIYNLQQITEEISITSSQACERKKLKQASSLYIKKFCKFFVGRLYNSNRLRSKNSWSCLSAVEYYARQYRRQWLYAVVKENWRLPCIIDSTLAVASLSLSHQSYRCTPIHLSGHRSVAFHFTIWQAASFSLRHKKIKLPSSLL